MRRTDRHTSEATPGSVVMAEITLRFGGRRLNGRVYWPQANAADTGSPLIFVPTLTESGVADRFCRLLCSAAAAIVLAVPGTRSTDHDYQLAALGWAVEHSGELGAHPARLMVAGEGAGGAHAARLAICARDIGWPRLRRQILVHPSFTQACPMPLLLTGVAPATVISSDTRIDDGSAYAARLRASEIEVDVLHYSPPILPGHDDLSAALVGGKR